MTLLLFPPKTTIFVDHGQRNVKEIPTNAQTSMNNCTFPFGHVQDEINILGPNQSYKLLNKE